MKLSADQYLGLLNSLLASGKSVQTSAKGASMAPTIPDGSLLDVQPVKPEEMQVGDIVLARAASGRPVYHRVTRIFGGRRRRQVQTWGDACARPDPPVPVGNVLGRVQAAEANGVRIDLAEHQRNLVRRMRRRYLRLWWRCVAAWPSALHRGATLCSPAQHDDS